MPLIPRPARGSADPGGLTGPRGYCCHTGPAMVAGQDRRDVKLPVITGALPHGCGFSGVSAAWWARGRARRFPGCLTGRSRLRGPVRCPVPGGAATVV